MSVISIENLNFSYDPRDPVIVNANLAVEEGEFMALIGPNGGGKSTLIHLISGLLKPLSGKIKVLDKSPKSASSKLGYVPQNTNFNRNFPITVKDVVLAGRLKPWQWRHRKEDYLACDRALDLMGVLDLSKERIGELSGGQRQRVLIARAISSTPEILLLDEPTANIDAVGEQRLYDALKTLNKEMTILIVSHDISVVSKHISSVACVNRDIHYHASSEITGDMLSKVYGDAMDYVQHHRHACGENH